MVLPTEKLLVRAMACRTERALLYVEHLREACETYAITTPERLAAFLATIGHESARLRYTRELWGPTAAQRRYEGRADLGNTHPGDGYRFLGRGLIQTTGRNNYAMTRDELRKSFSCVPDFVVEPEELELPRWASLSAGAFWHRKKLNELADKKQFLALSIRVNGKNKDGLPNGWGDRKSLYDKAIKELR